MRKLLVLDAKNYDESFEVIHRESVRGIIFKDGKLLLVQDNSGEVKLPGGGADEGESDLNALIREVREETGYEVIPDSVEEFGEIEEKRASIKDEPKIWNQFNRLYFCSVGDEQGECSYSPHEIRFGFRQVWYTLDEAIAINREMLDRDGEQAWNQREYRTLLAVKEYLEDKK